MSKLMDRYVEVRNNTDLSVRDIAVFLGVTSGVAAGYQYRAKKKGLVRPSNPGCRKVEAPAEPKIAGRLERKQAPAAALKQGGVTRFILTCAQNNTELHLPVWENLLALAEHYDARLLVARLVYNRFSEAADQDKKLIIEARGTKQVREYLWDYRITPYIHDEPLELAKGLVWRGDTNQSITAANPLASYESFTGRNSMIIPHTQVAMRSVCTHPSEGTKMMYTAGTVTMRNYIQRKAGQIADFHHSYGAVLVEVDADGTWFVRQLNAVTESGTLQDLRNKVVDGHVHDASILAINWGDIHACYADPVTSRLAWGEEIEVTGYRPSLIDTWRPSYQFMHDVNDFRVRNPHVAWKKEHLAGFIEHIRGNVNVKQEMEVTAELLRRAARPKVKTVVVDSNHGNDMFVRWLEANGDFRKDPENAVYFLGMAHHLWDQTARNPKHKPPNMLRYAMLVAGIQEEPLNIQFLDQDQPFILGGIQCGLHGHERFNGSRGGPMAFAKTGRKTSIGHVHSAGIWKGCYAAGIWGKLDQGYNTGLGSWSQSSIITYDTGKRAIFTVYDGKAHA